MRKKRLAEYEFQVQTEKIKKLMDQEIASKMRSKLNLGGAKIMTINEPKKNVSNIIQVKSKAPIFDDYSYLTTTTNQYTYDSAAFGDLALLGITEAELDQ